MTDDALIAELHGICAAALGSAGTNPATWGRADFAKMFRAMDNAADRIAALTQRVADVSAGNHIVLLANQELNDRATKAEAERDALRIAIACVYWQASLYLRVGSEFGSSGRDTLESALDCAAEDAGMQIGGSAGWPTARIRELCQEATTAYNAIAAAVAGAKGK